MSAVSRRMESAGKSLSSLIQLLEADYMAGRSGPEACDFLFGNPQEPALPGFVDALRSNAVPQNKDWFAYKTSEPDATAVVVGTLNASMSRQFRPEHILMTNGTFASLALCLAGLVDPGDEVIFVSPPWFFYEALIGSVGATPVRVLADLTAGI
ncbi:MAG: hypothetical protein ACT4OM_07990 [Actinomycetota bacterium]